MNRASIEYRLDQLMAIRHRRDAKWLLICMERLLQRQTEYEESELLAAYGLSQKRMRELIRRLRMRKVIFERFTYDARQLRYWDIDWSRVNEEQMP